MKEDFHIDSSNRFYDNQTVGIAFVGAISKKNFGYALNNQLKEKIRNELFSLSKYEEYAKLYAICIYYLIKDNLEYINRLIVCNDEDFICVKKYLLRLFNIDNVPLKFNIINITEFRISLGRKIKSLADNYARTYAKRALKVRKWKISKELNVVKINFKMIEEKWKL